MKAKKIYNVVRWCKYGALVLVVLIWWGRFFQYMFRVSYEWFSQEVFLLFVFILLFFVLWLAYRLMPRIDNLLFYFDRYLAFLLLVLCYAVYSYLDFYKDNFAQTIVSFVVYYFLAWICVDIERSIKAVEEIDSKIKLLR